MRILRLTIKITYILDISFAWSANSAVQTPVLSPPAPRKNSGSEKKTPAPAENFRLVQISQNWNFYSLNWKHHLCFFLTLRILRINIL